MARHTPTVQEIPVAGWIFNHKRLLASLVRKERQVAPVPGMGIRCQPESIARLNAMQASQITR